jgi:2-(1,2-epoxy-1,2-dihydrophenyl)acetyl-CoA isomerase
MELSVILSEHYNPIVSRIRSLEKPVIAAVNGVAAGAGANIALCCDVVVAASSASFIQAFSKIGLIPDSSGTYFLPRLIGWQKASALSMLGDKVAAADAERMGMLYKVIADEQFSEESISITSTLAAMPTKGLAYTKQLLNVSFANSFEAQLKEEDRVQQLAASTEDYQEGITAFLEKRQAQFKGK